ncbi:hypothetical protein CEXT_609161 [Caerostris extrusa]|uniref:Uncharacterized protein n=1 Tax=Caerostris extrusa TaxID=172846 RepID=A0AAV4P604_CAEEX|nr:hypothetical protein CEXT_609161 [Caerostris extrusa]
MGHSPPPLGGSPLFNRGPFKEIQDSPIPHPSLFIKLDIATMQDEQSKRLAHAAVPTLCNSTVFCPQVYTGMDLLGTCSEVKKHGCGPSQPVLVPGLRLCLRTLHYSSNPYFLRTLGSGSPNTLNSR